jgi:hypothetical protein
MLLIWIDSNQYTLYTSAPLLLLDISNSGGKDGFSGSFEKSNCQSAGHCA